MPLAAMPHDLARPTDAQLDTFRQRLPAWFEQAKRAMPWRETRDPYRIWLSEVMLQQTRVDQAEPYYRRFLGAFPTVEALAEATLDEVLLRWEGLGYYSRARNLHRAARMIVEEFGGRVPDEYEAIRRLPGVGPYTAAAVLSIAFGRAHAVLDGNVIRVLTRVFEVGDDATSSRTRRRLQELADVLVPPERPGAFNEAMMELGATVCTPHAPACSECPLQAHCGANRSGTQEHYPVTPKRAPVPHYDVAVGIVENARGEVLIQQRPEEAMLGGLWEFPGGKREPDESLEETCARELSEELQIEVSVDGLVHRLKHAYTHFRITLHAFRCRILRGEPTPPEGIALRWVPLAELDGYAFPRANRLLIEELRARAGRPTLFDGM